VKAEQIRQLRARLGCTVRELARALELEPRVVRDWEAAEAFPTKRHVQQLQRLDEAGPAAIREKSAKGPATESRLDQSLLADPSFFLLVQKLVADPELYRRVLEMAEVAVPETEPTP
jgi:transcriptional regulator with XRE-family HTH domain